MNSSPGVTPTWYLVPFLSFCFSLHPCTVTLPFSQAKQNILGQRFCSKGFRKHRALGTNSTFSPFSQLSWTAWRRQTVERWAKFCVFRTCKARVKLPSCSKASSDGVGAVLLRTDGAFQSRMRARGKQVESGHANRRPLSLFFSFRYFLIL